MGIFGLFSKEKKESLDQGLAKTRESVFSKINRAIAGKSKVDESVLDDLEEILISSDVGVETTIKIIDRIEKRVSRDKYVGSDELNRILREEIMALLEENNSEDASDFDIAGRTDPYVIMVEEKVFSWGQPTPSGLRPLNSCKSGPTECRFLLLNKKWAPILHRLLMIH
jgi:fused signal recognition particle receptor